MNTTSLITGTPHAHHSYTHLDSLLEELEGIGKQIARSELNDQMTQAIEKWRKEFERTFRSVGSRVVPRFIDVLKKILCNSLPPYNLLDEDALLGSDGYTYNRTALEEYQKKVPEEYREAPPLNRRNLKPGPFETELHPNLGCIFSWLTRSGIKLREEKLDRENYKKAERGGIAPSRYSGNKAAEREEKMRRIMALQAERERSAASKSTAFMKDFEQKWSLEREKMLQTGYTAIVDKRAEELSKGALQRMGKLEQEHKELQAALKQTTEKLRLEIEAHARQIELLQKQLSDIKNGQLAAVNRQQIEVDLAIEQLIHDMEDRKDSWVKDVAIAVAVIGVCVFATWALAGALASTGAVGTVAPIANGGIGNGFMIGITIPI